MNLNDFIKMFLVNSLAGCVVILFTYFLFTGECKHEAEIKHLKEELCKCNSDIKKAEHLMNDSNIVVVSAEY